MFKLISLLVFLCASFASSANVIDKLTKLKNYDQKNWFVENIPFIDIPDSTIEEVYYYRWATHKRHLRYITPGMGYMVTEFILDVGWAAKLGALVDAAGHHIYESRWIKDSRYVEDYINFFSRAMDKYACHEYSEWMADAAYNAYLLIGNKDFIASQVDGFVRIYHDWAAGGNGYTRTSGWEPSIGMFYIVPHDDAQEYSAASVQTSNQFQGGLGYRPSHNSEQYANAMAIAKMAAMAGNTKVETEFTNNAKALREAIIKYLWDDSRKFFYHVQRENNPNHQLLDTREEVGFYPWRFGVPDERHNYSLAFDQLFDAQGFNTAYGPSTCETRSKWYDGEQKPPTCCWWNGNSWPYSTSHTLRSLAVHLRQYSQQNPKITVDNYVSLLKKYALTQHKNNKPYVAECHSPTHDTWVGDSSNHSEHYAHSTYVDNVLYELMGIVPQEDNTLLVDPLVPKTWDHFAVENVYYRGYEVSVYYDSTGSKYNMGKGLSVYVDGKLKTSRADLGSLTIKDIGTTKSKTKTAKRLENYAANPKNAAHPKASASHGAGPNQANDGRIFYDQVPSNHWTSQGSTSATDWFAIDFGRVKTFDSMNLYVYADGSNTACPSKMVVQYMSESNEWTDAAGQVFEPKTCAPNDLNKVTFTPVKTSQLRVVFTRDGNHGVGLTEVEVWAEYPQTSSVYEAEDGLIVDATMVSSDTASGTSFVRLNNNQDSSVEMSGIYVPKTGDYKVRVFYASNGQSATETILVNNLHSVPISYGATSGGAGHFSNTAYVEVTLPLMGGDNVVWFQHKQSFVELDKIEVVSS